MQQQQLIYGTAHINDGAGHDLVVRCFAIGENHIYRTFYFINEDGTPAYFPAPFADMLRYHFVENEPGETTPNSPWVWYQLSDDSIKWVEDYDEADDGPVQHVFRVYFADDLLHLDD